MKQVRIKILTKNEDRRVAQQCTSDSKTLFLSAGQVRAAFTELGIVTFRKIADELVHQSGTADLLDFPPRNAFRPPATPGAGKAHRDILVDGHIEKNTGLRDTRNLLPTPILV